MPKIQGNIAKDIGKVLLNPNSKAFHIVEKKTKVNAPKLKPEVIVGTLSFKSLSGNLCVRRIVKGNGFGIPQSIREKFFQPFLNTKPTSQEPRLRLSLSYDNMKA